MSSRSAAGAIVPHADVTRVCDARAGVDVASPAASGGAAARRPAALSPPARPARAAMFATVCTLLAIAGHVAAGRAAVAPRAIVVGFVALYLVAWVLTNTERSMATILGGLLGGQFILHALFAAAAAPAAVAPAARMLGAHSMHSGAPAGAVTSMTSMTVKPPGDSLGGGLTMTFAHVAAALVAAWWLRRGERTAWTLARRAAAVAAYPLRALRYLTALLVAASAAAPDARPAPTGLYDSTRLIGPRSVTLRGPVTRRGPPFGWTAFIYG